MKHRLGKIIFFLSVQLLAELHGEQQSALVKILLIAGTRVVVEVVLRVALALVLGLWLLLLLLGCAPPHAARPREDPRPGGRPAPPAATLPEPAEAVRPSRQGACELGKVLDELKRQKFDGTITCEYERMSPNLEKEIGECVTWYNAYFKK